MTGDIELTDEFLAAIALMESGANMFITGKAGTGKSTLLRHFVEAAVEKKKAVAVTAFMGLAALNAGGVTLHSFFGFRIGVLQPHTIKRNPRLVPLLNKLDTLVIDEISMVRADIFEAINKSLQVHRKSSLPFGGVQIVLFGDPYQLSPIWANYDMDNAAQDDLEWTNRFFFETDAYRQGGFTPLILSKIFRQKDMEFINALNNVREGCVTNKDITFLNSRQIPVNAENMTTLASVNIVVNRINESRLQKLPGQEYTYEADMQGTFKFGMQDNFKKDRYPADVLLRLKEGARIVMLRNDPGTRWFNGTLGFIHSLTQDAVTVRIPSGLHDVQRVTWEQTQYTVDPITLDMRQDIVGTFTQFPIKLAWALTIHKAQGQSFDEVLIDLGARAAFAEGQTYVALSRCRSPEGMFLARGIVGADIKVDHRVREFMGGIEKSL